MIHQAGSSLCSCPTCRRQRPDVALRTLDSAARAAAHLRPNISYRTYDPQRLSPSMSELLFHTPWWIPAIPIAVGVVMYVSAIRAGKSGLRMAAIAIAAVGVLHACVSLVVDSDVEKVEKRSNE